MEVKRIHIRKPRYVICAYVCEEMLTVPVYATVTGDYFCGLLPRGDGASVRFSGDTLHDAIEDYFSIRRLNKTIRHDKPAIDQL